MVRRLKHKVAVHPEWKFSWKKLDLQISSLLLVVFSGIDVLQMSFSGIPKHILELVPYGNGIAVGLFGLNLVGRLFVLKRKEPSHES
ncbi:MAG: hypothetical protein RSF86_13555 [Angelakisella sp.]